jgi:Lon protease-like protein
MGVCDLYQKPDDLPRVIPIFPLGGALLLPRGQLPLNVFEPRYLAMVNDAMASDRIIGMVQPDCDEALALQDDPDAKPSLCRIGCAGRITSFTETGDGRILITLTGIARFQMLEEIPAIGGYRRFQVDASGYADDFCPGAGQAEVDRDRLVEIFHSYLDAHDLEADWESVNASSNEALVNALSMISPYGPKEKQALLEAPDLRTRNEILIALTEMALAQSACEPEAGSRLQ